MGIACNHGQSMRRETLPLTNMISWMPRRVVRKSTLKGGGGERIAKGGKKTHTKWSKINTVRTKCTAINTKAAHKANLKLHGRACETSRIWKWTLKICWASMRFPVALEVRETIHLGGLSRSKFGTSTCMLRGQTNSEQVRGKVLCSLQFLNEAAQHQLCSDPCLIPPTGFCSGRQHK